MNNLQARAAKVIEDAKTDYTPNKRLVSGTEPKPIQTEHRPMSNSQHNRNTGKSTLKELSEIFK